jgi:hypothetical protein
MINTKIIIISCLAILILAFIAIYILMNRQSFLPTPQATATNQIIQQAQKEPNEDQYKDWIIYINQKEEISIRMPNNWLIDEARNSDNSQTGEVTFTRPEEDKDSTVSKIWLGIGIKKDGMSTQEEFNKYKDMKDGTPIQNSDLEKIGVATSKNGDAILFLSKSDNSLLSWINVNATNIYIQTFNTSQISESDVMLHKYLISTIGVID